MIFYMLKKFLRLPLEQQFLHITDIDPFRKYPLRKRYLLNEVHAGLDRDQT